MTPITTLKNKPCIYVILNTITGKRYVGKTKCIYKRCYQYTNAFKREDYRKINRYLMNSFKKYGIENFQMYPVEFCSLNVIAERELHWITELKTTERDIGYNLRLDSSTGMVAHKETSEKISSNLKRQWASGVRDDHSQKLKDSWVNNPERKAVQSALFTKYKTKYCYIVRFHDTTEIVLTYQGLVKMKLHTSVPSYFHRHAGDRHECKGYDVERVAV